MGGGDILSYHRPKGRIYSTMDLRKLYGIQWHKHKGSKTEFRQPLEVASIR